ncbi:MAG: hypothetical protein ABJJ05_15205 [Maribacter litoralis]|uniref:hypothetical protein n=1 Tax=Maribacter litoralis TaxID=2059726 RepID=UPI0032982409
MDNKTLELLSASLRTVGGNFDIPTLDLILTVLDKVKAKGESISIGDVKGISKEIAKKYGIDKQ